MKQQHDTPETFTHEQLVERQTAICGTDAAPILAWHCHDAELSPWRQVAEVYYDKIADEPISFPPNEAMRWGTALERAIADEYARRHALTLTPGAFVRHPELDYVAGNPDFTALDDDGQPIGIEIKNVGTRSGAHFGPSGTPDVPPHYYAQVQHYLLATGFEQFVLVALIAGQQLSVHPIAVDPAWQATMLDAYARFWQLVQSRTPPAWDHARPDTERALRAVYASVDDDQAVELEIDAQHWHDVLVESERRASEYTAAAKCARAHLLDLIGTAGSALLPDGSTYRRKLISVAESTVTRAAYSYVSLKHHKPKRIEP
jgi:predicted phage-related endonuclease